MVPEGACVKLGNVGGQGFSRHRTFYPNRWTTLRSGTGLTLNDDTLFAR